MEEIGANGHMRGHEGIMHLGAKHRGNTVSFLLKRDGTICDCDEAAESIFGVNRHKLLSRHVSTVLPQLTDIPLWEDGRLNPHLAFRTHIGQSFDANASSGHSFPCRIFLTDLDNSHECHLRLVVRPMAAE